MNTNKSRLLTGADGRNYLIPFILVTSLFFLWGVANNMTDTLLSAFKNIMEMSDFQTSFIQMAFYGSYACFAIPAALLIRKYTFKHGIIVGLSLYALGTFLFYPAAQMASYGFYLFALYVLAGGLSILETTANPYILTMGRPETQTRRLNMAQSFNPIGSISGIIISQIFILSQLSANKSEMSAGQLLAAQHRELSAVTYTYMGLGVILLAILLIMIFYKGMPASKEISSVSFGKTVKTLARKKHYSFGVVAQFFYVGAQIGVWSYTIRYVMSALNLVDPSTDEIIPANVSAFISENTFWSGLWQLDNTSTAENIGNSFYLTSLILFTLSRFIFTALMKFFRPGMLLALAAAGAIAASLVAIFSTGMPGVIGLVMISFFMSLMFPTIYGIALEGISENEAKVGGSFLVMAILGGALLTAVQGYVSTAASSAYASYWVPLVCFVIVAWYGLFANKDEKAAENK
ncbi:MAG: L-fucose:H+ symporter permease [Paludibacter sp. 47-17]|nr:MAG: L-fucose:H+ symporter permease [Paludibacter sp. SCN 50-10]OJX90051.1 MAG: L-fucose:H+ symporter permease [Paludibacter sp. 47-17]